ncbi:hypothetical protein [Mucilaginibacter sp.]|uniref:hypothetical protein n=1 Tax=Mucilaginibacter sp. TaxID=1882438 RepID=UPI0035BC13A7
MNKSSKKAHCVSVNVSRLAFDKQFSTDTLRLTNNHHDLGKNTQQAHRHTDETPFDLAKIMAYSG